MCAKPEEYPRCCSILLSALSKFNYRRSEASQNLSGADQGASPGPDGFTSLGLVIFSRDYHQR